MTQPNETAASIGSNRGIGLGIAQAMNDGDLPRLLSFLAEDVEVNEPNEVPWPGSFKGHTGFQDLLAKIGSRLLVEILRVDVFEGLDGLLAVRMHARFTSQATDRSIESSVAEVHEIRDGLVHRTDVFYKEPRLVAELFADGH